MMYFDEKMTLDAVAAKTMVLVLLIVFFVGKVQAESLDERASRMVKVENERTTYPVKMNNKMEAVGFIATGRTVSYIYRYSKYDINNWERHAKKLQHAITRNTCKEEPPTSSFMLGIDYNYIYTNPVGHLLGGFTVTREDCREAATKNSTAQKELLTPSDQEYLAEYKKLTWADQAVIRKKLAKENAAKAAAVTPVRIDSVTTIREILHRSDTIIFKATVDAEGANHEQLVATFKEQGYGATSGTFFIL